MSMTVDDLAIITFSELKQLNDEDLAMCVNKDAAIKICRKSLECSEAAADEIFHLWVHKLNKMYEVENYSATEWQQLMEFFIEMVQQFKDEQTSGNKVLPVAILNVLCDALELLQWFRQLHNRLDVNKWCISLQFALKIVVQFFAYYRKNSTSCDLNEILQQTLLLHNLSLQFLNESVDIFKINDSEEFKRLTEVQITLCMLIEDAPPINLKTIIETWKCVTKLTIYCVKFSNTFNNESIQHMKVMAFRPIKFLLHEIHRSLEIIYKEETLQQPIEQVEKYLRITNFYLMLLQRLADAFRHERFPCIDEFLKTFITSKTPPKYLTNTELIDILEKYVLHDLGELFNMVYKNQQIEEMLLDGSSQNKSNEFNIIAKEFMRATLANKHDIFINGNIDLFIKIFQYFAKDVNNFCDSNAYNEVVELFAALAILNSTGELKKDLRSAILRDDFILAHTSMDVLLTIARCCHTSSDELLQNFRYWRQCNKYFALFTINPRELQVCLLLQCYYRLCQAKALINTTELENAEFEDTEVLSSAHRLFIALPETCEVVADNKLRKSFDILEKREVMESVNNFYGMLVKIKCLSRNNVPEEKTLSSILNMTLKIAKTSTLDLRLFSRLLTGVLEFVTKYFAQLDEETIFSILKICKQHTAKLDDCVLPALYLFLQAAQAKTQQLELSAAEILSELTTKPDTKLLQEIFVFKKFQTIEICKTNSDLYSQLILKPFVKHNCKPYINYQTIKPPKRLRIEEDGALTFVLNDMLDKSQQLLCLPGKLDAHDLHLINSIKNNLNTILTNQQSTNQS